MIYSHVRSSSEFGDEDFTIDPKFNFTDTADFDPLNPTLAAKNSPPRKTPRPRLPHFRPVRFNRAGGCHVQK